jgi:hypothetical protein
MIRITLNPDNTVRQALDASIDPGEMFVEVADAEWQAAARYPKVQITWDGSHLVVDLGHIKDLMWTRVKNARDTKRQTSGYQVAGKWFHSDDYSKQQQVALVLLGASLPAGLQWKTMDGSFVPMTPTLAQQVFGAAVLFDQAVFAAAELHNAAMRASEDPASYDFSGGWPPAFQG